MNGTISLYQVPNPSKFPSQQTIQIQDINNYIYIPRRLKQITNIKVILSRCYKRYNYLVFCPLPYLEHFVSRSLSPSSPSPPLSVYTHSKIAPDRVLHSSFPSFPTFHGPLQFLHALILHTSLSVRCALKSLPYLVGRDPRFVQRRFEHPEATTRIKRSVGDATSRGRTLGRRWPSSSSAERGSFRGEPPRRDAGYRSGRPSG